MSHSLKGVRIWLSGSIDPDATDEEKNRLKEFLINFAAKVFHRDGRLIHGCHPSITPILIDAAKLYKAQRHEKSGLVLCVSRFYSKKSTEQSLADTQEFTIDTEEWNQLCFEPVIQTREDIPDESGNISAMGSLQILRDTLAEQSNIIVALGGKWWREAGDQGGVPQEIELARQLDCLLYTSPSPRD